MRGDKDKDIRIGSVIEAMYKRYRLDAKVNELKIKKDWEDIFGRLIANHTNQIELKGKTLYVTVTNGPLRNELFLQRDLMIAKLNEYYELVIIEKVFIQS